MDIIENTRDGKTINNIGNFHILGIRDLQKDIQEVVHLQERRSKDFQRNWSRELTCVDGNDIV